MRKRSGRSGGSSRRRPRAETSDILGPKPPRERVPAKWREPYDHLQALRTELLKSHADLTKDALAEQPTYSSHMADAGTDTFDRDLALGVLSTQQDAVYEIEQALERIRAGTYGICEATRKPIEKSRLQAIPWTRFSAAAEKELEEEGALKRAHLGPRDTVAKESSDSQSSSDEE